MSACRSCGAQVLWCRTERGRTMPVDEEPVADGNIVLTADGQAIVLSLDAANVHDGPLHLSHFATCPNADSHRSAR